MSPKCHKKSVSNGIAIASRYVERVSEKAYFFSEIFALSLCMLSICSRVTVFTLSVCRGSAKSKKKKQICCRIFTNNVKLVDFEGKQ